MIRAMTLRRRLHWTHLWPLCAMAVACAPNVSSRSRLGSPGLRRDILQPAGNAEVVCRDDSSLFAVAAHAASNTVDSVWPGFWRPQPSFILYRPDSIAFLVASAPAPDGFSPIKGNSLPAILAGRAFVHWGSLPRLTGSIDLHYHAANALVDAVAIPINDDCLTTLGTLYHEAFHVYQSKAFAADSGAGFVDDSLLSAGEVLPLIELERRILSRVLSVPRSAARVSLLQQFLAIRVRRALGTGAEPLLAQRHFERIEGSANYVELAGALLSSHRDAGELSDTLRRYLDAPLSAYTGTLADRALRWNAYGTGAAMAVLLTQLGVKWTPLLEEGAAFDGLLADAIHFDSASAPEFAAAAFREFHYSEIIGGTVRKEEQAAHTGTEVLDSFRRRNGIRLILELQPPRNAPVTAPAMTFSSDSFSQPAKMVFVMPLAKVFAVSWHGATVQSRGKPVLADMHQLPALFRMEILLSAFPTVNGDDTARFSGRVDSLQLRGPGIEVTATRAAEIRWAQDSVIVRIGP